MEVGPITPPLLSVPVKAMFPSSTMFIPNSRPMTYCLRISSVRAVPVTLRYVAAGIMGVTTSTKSSVTKGCRITVYGPGHGPPVEVALPCSNALEAAICPIVRGLPVPQRLFVPLSKRAVKSWSLFRPKQLPKSVPATPLTSSWSSSIRLSVKITFAPTSLRVTGTLVSTNVWEFAMSTPSVKVLAVNIPQ